MPRTLCSSIIAIASRSAAALPSVLATSSTNPCFHASSCAPLTICPANGVLAMASATSPMNRELPRTRVLASALGR
ncbi:hypothetical protein ACFQV2_31760 [Actinokineospora soli]|uniref:Secreted protein n=1 Tax=Actinokineospora soli TaxID=1048753 RepID=A0ABW2TTX2_9PSEU